MRRVLVAGLLLALGVPDPAQAELAAGNASRADGWLVRASAEGRGLGAVEHSITQPRGARPNEARPWLQHELVLRNSGRTAITFADTRTARLLPGLVVADEGCGYSLRPLSPVCLAYLEILTLEPGQSTTRTITLWKGLPQMASLEAGRYVFTQNLRFRRGHVAPGRRGGRAPTVQIVYRIAAG